MGNEAYDRLSERDKAAVDLVAFQKHFQDARQGNEAQKAGRHISDDQLIAMLGEQAMEKGVTKTRFPAMSRLLEAQFEINRDQMANRPETMPWLRQNLDKYLADNPKITPQQITRVADGLIAIDGDQFDVQRDLPGGGSGPRSR